MAKIIIKIISLCFYCPNHLEAPHLKGDCICRKKRKLIDDCVWGIPKWCPLPDAPKE